MRRLPSSMEAYFAFCRRAVDCFFIFKLFLIDYEYGSFPTSFLCSVFGCGENSLSNACCSCCRMLFSGCVNMPPLLKPELPPLLVDILILVDSLPRVCGLRGLWLYWLPIFKMFCLRTFIPCLSLFWIDELITESHFVLSRLFGLGEWPDKLSYFSLANWVELYKLSLWLILRGVFDASLALLSNDWAAGIRVDWRLPLLFALSLLFSVSKSNDSYY